MGTVSGAAPGVALVFTRPGSPTSDVVVERADSPDHPTSIGGFSHQPSAAIRAAVIPGRNEVVAVADVDRSGDFPSGLFHVRGKRVDRPLVRGLFHASRPLPINATHVLVERGVEGPPLSGKLRVDALSVDLVELSTGSLRQVHAYSGYTTHLVAVDGPEVLLYRVGAEGADLAAVHLKTSAVRVLTPLVPMARDFYFDSQGRRLLFTNGLREERAWGVFSVSLKTGELKRLSKGTSPSLAPWTFATSSSTRPGHRLVESLPAEGFHLWVSQGSGTRSRPIVVEARTSRVMPLSVPPGQRVDVAGFVAGAPP